MYELWYNIKRQSMSVEMECKEIGLMLVDFWRVCTAYVSARAMHGKRVQHLCDLYSEGTTFLGFSKLRSFEMEQRRNAGSVDIGGISVK